MKKITIAFLMGTTLLLSACATTVKPTYVSPTQYQALNCQQLQAEYNRIQQHLDEGVPCLLYTSPSPRDRTRSRMPSSA